jgi:hypothetical protein
VTDEDMGAGKIIGGTGGNVFNVTATSSRGLTLVGQSTGQHLQRHPRQRSVRP